jgi:hypothetical protein
MHTCPECGMSCCCQGDLDDCVMDTEETYDECIHLCEPDPDEDERDFDDLGMPGFDEEPSCRVCGCTQSQACAGGCIWAEPNLCSRCVVIPREQGGAS